MNNKTLAHDSTIAIYQTDDGLLTVDVCIEGETVWLSLNQIAELFGRNKSVISKHLKNIFSSEELARNSVVAKFATTAADGKTYQVEHYNLDMIISVGYRVNSKRGIQFRQWASRVLKEYLIQGYTVNQTTIYHLQQTVNLLSDTLIKENLVDNTGGYILQIIQEYAKTWDTLLRYDEKRFDLPITSKLHIALSYETALEAIQNLKEDIQGKGENTTFFGQERHDALQAILGNLEQTFDGIPVYSSCEERAAHLLYFIIKDHPFNDGNKRIASLLFLIQLKQDKINTQKINDVGLTALTLLMAQSSPQQKEITIQLIMSLLL